MDVSAVKRLMAQSMPALVESPDFFGLLRFVVNIGAEAAPFIKHLKEFVGLCGQNRQVRIATFALAGQLPVSVPYVIIGLVLMSYTAPDAFFVDGFARYLSHADIRLLLNKETGEATQATINANEVLRYFHVTCVEAKAFDGMSNVDRLDFLGMLDSLVCRALTREHICAP